MRLACLAAIMLALQSSPAAAQALRLADSLVAGAWEIPDISKDPDRGLPLFHYAGTVRDMREPDFWQESQSLSLRRNGRGFPGTPTSDPEVGAPAFDVLGRNPSRDVPVRLFRPLPAVNSR